MPATKSEVKLAPTTVAILGKAKEVSTTFPGSTPSEQHRIFERQIKQLAELGITHPTGSDVLTGVEDGKNYQRWFFEVGELVESVRSVINPNNVGPSGMTGRMEATLIDGPVKLPRGKVDITPILNTGK